VKQSNKTLRDVEFIAFVTINADDAYWKFFVQLKEIVEMVFALQLAVGHVILLQQCIQNHLATFKSYSLTAYQNQNNTSFFIIPNVFCCMDLNGPAGACVSNRNTSISLI
jgi:hypothetical protein